MFKVKASDFTFRTHRITLEVSGRSSEVLALKELFPDIIVLYSARGEKTPTHEEGSPHNFVQLCIGDGIYPEALGSAESWLSKNAPEIERQRLLQAHIAITISIPLILNGGATWSGSLTRVPLSLVRLCSEGQIDICFSASITRDGE